jgi:hypothetical protein
MVVMMMLLLVSMVDSIDSTIVGDAAVNDGVVVGQYC